MTAARFPQLAPLIEDIAVHAASDAECDGDDRNIEDGHSAGSMRLSWAWFLRCLSQA